MRVGPLRRIFVDPRRRIPVAALMAVATSFALAAWQPLVSLWLGAALLGVPHVLSGVRHVAIRDRLTPLTRAAAVAGVAVGAAQLAGAGDGAVRAFVLLFALAVGAELAAALGGAARALALAGVVVTTAAALRSPRVTLLALAHLHAVGAVIWFAVRARRRGVPAWPLLVATGLVLLGGALGAFDRLWAATLFAPRSAAGSILAEAAGAIGLGASRVAMRRVLFLYAFGQALHFAIWLRLGPELDRPTPLPHSFGRALALLSDDLGRLTWPALAACLVAPPLIAVGGGAAREAYFALTFFHVGLEAAALARALAGAEAPPVAWGATTRRRAPAAISRVRRRPSAPPRADRGSPSAAAR